MTTKRRAMMANGGKLPKFGEDHISKLNDDCFLDIFSRLDHNDLDEVAPVNRRMSRLAKASRHCAFKLEAGPLVVSQAEARYWFCTEHAGARYYLKFRREADYAAMGVHENMPTPPRRWGEIMTRKKDWLDPIIVNGEEVAAHRDRIHNLFSTGLLVRFDFKSCDLRLGPIEEFILPLIEKAVSFCHHGEIKLVSSENKLDEASNSRLASLLISANPLEMTVCLPHSESGVRFVDEAFMKAYADSIFMPSLTVYLKYFEDDRLSLHPENNRAFSNILPQFRTLVIPHLIVDTGNVMEQLLERLRRGKPGQLHFRMDRNFHGSEVQEAAIAAGMKYSSKSHYASLKYRIAFMNTTIFYTKEESVEIYVGVDSHEGGLHQCISTFS